MGLELDIILSSLLGRGRMLFQGRMIARHRNQYNNTQRQSTGSSSNNHNNNNNSIHKSTGKILPKNVDIDGKPIIEKSIFSVGTSHISHTNNNSLSSKGKGGSISSANDMLYHFMTDWKSQYILLIEINGKGMLIVLDPYTHMVYSIVHLDRVTGVSITITTITITTTASTTNIYSTLLLPYFPFIFSLISANFILNFPLFSPSYSDDQ